MRLSLAGITRWFHFRCSARHPVHFSTAVYNYGATILPARVRHSQDKAKVETGMQNVERQILAPLRHRTFFLLSKLNQTLREPAVLLQDFDG